MRVIASCAISLDGYLDDDTDQRLYLSSLEDFDEVDELRSRCDAILVGANTVRNDNSRLVVRSDDRRARRQHEGRSSTPSKVILTRSGNLDPAARVFTTGECKKFIACPRSSVSEIEKTLGGVGEIIAVETPHELLEALSFQGVESLLIEGGATVLATFFENDLVDELRLAIAPLFAGRGTRFAGPRHASARWRLVDAHIAGDTTVLSLHREKPVA